MTGHDRIRRRREFTFRNMQVSSANTTGSHSNDQFVWLRRWIGDIADPHTSRLIDDSSTHGYTSLNKLTLLRLDNRLSYFNNGDVPARRTGRLLRSGPRRLRPSKWCFPRARMLIAAFTSLSSSAAQSQECQRSDKS